MSSVIRFHCGPFTELDSLFDDAFNARFWSSASSPGPTSKSVDSFRPRLDLYESKDANTVTATFELPGLKSEDVTIDLHHNRLTVCGESSPPESHRDEGGYAIRERRYGKFSRTLQLPPGTKLEDVKGKMEDGLLTLSFQKATEQQPERIIVQ